MLMKRIHFMSTNFMTSGASCMLLTDNREFRDRGVSESLGWVGNSLGQKRVMTVLNFIWHSRDSKLAQNGTKPIWGVLQMLLVLRSCGQGDLHLSM
ncbi:hypothetical protein ScPMuIL_005292 [Solemya velum]